jgi:thiol-disulfide isomerase/thioredoxin
MNKVPKVILPALLTLVLLVTNCVAVGTQTGNLAPDFQLQNLDGQTVSLSSLRGNPVMLNFWATWCGPCRAEMPYLQQIHDEWSDRGLVLLAIDLGESSSTVESYLKSNNLSLTVLLDTRQEVGRKYDIRPIPTTFFIDEDGIIQRVKVGAFQSKEQIEQYLVEIMP